MALQVPSDIPHTQFTRTGLIFIDGDAFEGQSWIGTSVLLREINFMMDHIKPGNLRTRAEWLQVRDVCLLWCFSHRTAQDNDALNSFLTHLGIDNISVPINTTETLFAVMEARFDACTVQVDSSSAWTYHRPPPQRLPTPASLSPTSTSTPPDQNSNNEPTHTHQPISANTPPPITPSPPPTQPNPDLNTNPHRINKYTFTEHQQEYPGHQFQCIFRCLRDNKHCRKAPVREMNRHLRTRHHFRQGFKIAGVDWVNRRWRGAGADHEECVGRIVVKESDDPVCADDREEEGYIVR